MMISNFKNRIFIFSMTLLVQPLTAMQPAAKKIETKKEIDRTPQHLTELLIGAVERDDRDDALAYLEFGADVNAPGGLLGWTPLMEAVNNRSEGMCRFLLEQGADISVTNETDHTVIDMIATRDNTSLCKLLITQATFKHPGSAPFMHTFDEIQRHESRNCLFTFLLCLKRICPELPRDIRYTILCATPRLRQQTMSAAFGIHRGHPERIPLFPIEIVRALIKGGILSQEIAIESIKNYNTSIILPLLDDARHGTQKKEMHELLDPEKFEENFGTSMKEHIAKRLTA